MAKVTRRGVAMVVAVCLVALGAVTVAARPVQQEGFPRRPSILVAEGESRSGSWQAWVGQSPDGPYLQIRADGGRYRMGAGDETESLRGLSSALMSDGDLVYGAVDDTVAQVTARFDGGGSRQLEVFRLADVGFFYGKVRTTQRVAALELNDAWGERVGTVVCNHDDDRERRSVFGTGCVEDS